MFSKILKQRIFIWILLGFCGFAKDFNYDFDDLLFDIVNIEVSEQEHSLHIFDNSHLILNSKSNIRTELNTIQLIPEDLMSLCNDRTSKLKKLVQFTLFNTNFHIVFLTERKYLFFDFDDNDLVLLDTEEFNDDEFNVFHLELIEEYSDKVEVFIKHKDHTLCIGGHNRLTFCSKDDSFGYLVRFVLKLSTKKDTVESNEVVLDVSDEESIRDKPSNTLLYTFLGTTGICGGIVVALVLYIKKEEKKHKVMKLSPLSMSSIDKHITKQDKQRLTRWSSEAKPGAIKSRSPSPGARLHKYESLDIDL